MERELFLFLKDEEEINELEKSGLRKVKVLAAEDVPAYPLSSQDLPPAFKGQNLC